MPFIKHLIMAQELTWNNSRILFDTKKPTVIEKKAKEYRLNNRDYFNRKNKEWKAKTGYGKKYQQERLKKDVLFRFINRLRTLIRISITKQGFNKNSNAHEILGCDYNKVIEHLENKFEEFTGYKPTTKKVSQLK